MVDLTVHCLPCLSLVYRDLWYTDKTFITLGSLIFLIYPNQ